MIRIGVGIPRDCQKPGVLGTYSKAGMRLRQLKRSVQKTQGTKNIYIFISHPMMQKGIRKLGTNNS